MLALVSFTSNQATFSSPGGRNAEQWQFTEQVSHSKHKGAPYFSLMQPIWAVPPFLAWQLWVKREVSQAHCWEPVTPDFSLNLTVKLAVLIVIVISLQDSLQHTRLFPDKPEQPRCSGVSVSHKVATTAFEEMCRLFSVTNHFPFLSVFIN